MAHPFIRICTPIYHGVSPCSTFAYHKLTTSTTNISHTQEKSPRASASMQFATNRACCAAQATRTSWRGDGPSTQTAPTTARRGCPKQACGTDTTLVQSPEHGPRVRCKAPFGARPCRAGCANGATSSPRSLAWRGRDQREGHDSDDDVSLRVVTPPFSRGL